jgi:hypothetical protein
MRVGSVRITGVSKRFYGVLGGVVALIILLIILGGSKSKAPNPYLTPAFAPSELSSSALQSSGWSGSLISANGLFQPTASTELTGEGYAAHLGLPMRFKVYLFDSSTVQQSRPDLIFQKNGYVFEPAEFLPPDEPVSINSLTSSTNTLPPQPIELGFREDDAPPPNTAYEVTGLLWYRTDLFNPAGQAALDGQTELASPIILVDTAQALSDAELRAPATQREDLDLDYQEGPLALNVNDVEWSSGNEMRVCVSLTNTSGQSVALWPGVSSMTADIGSGSVPGTPDPASALSSASQLQPYQSIPGYIVFPSSVADPTQQLVLRMPTLQSPTSASSTNGEQDSIIVNVPHSGIVNVDQSQEQTTNCGTGAVSAQPSSEGAGLGGSAGAGTVGTVGAE